MNAFAGKIIAAPSVEGWLEVLAFAARHYRLPLSPQQARLAALWETEVDDAARVRAMARASGLSVQFHDAGTLRWTVARLPAAVELADGDLALVTAIDGEGHASLMLAGEGGTVTPMPLAELQREGRRVALIRPARGAPDARVDAYIRPFQRHWLRDLLFADRRAYGHVVVASLVTNVLALAGTLFSMQVYDRVVPAESYVTLTMLFAGVVIAVGFEFLLRRMRVDIVDVLGKRADLRISDLVFGHALRVRNQARPTSTGSFIAQLRDLDQVRDLLTSTTVAAIADLPFFLLFLGLLWFIAGPLALVPLGAVVLLLVPGLLAQRRLRALATEAMRESSLRNAMLVEAIQGIEDVKTLQAEERFQRQWRHYNAVSGEAQLRLRSLTSSLASWTQAVQNLVYATIILAGVPLVIGGDLTTGALVAASILGSRMMTPLGQVTSLFGRYQQARVAASGLDQIMALPVDNPGQEQRIPLPAVAGRFAIRDAVWSYADPNAPPALSIASLDIAAGEKIALLGRNGAGKSTLLQGLSGMLQPARGEVLLDDLALHQIDPADVRRDVGLLTQRSRLFHGTLRENLLLGAPRATDAEVVELLSAVGADAFVRCLRDGLDHLVLEGGAGLSGGQVQALLLARLMLRGPSVALLDEPSAAMDEAAERHFLDTLRGWGRGRTLVIATHRLRVLDIVDRVIVLDGGAVVLDAPRDDALRTMRGARKEAA